MTIVATVATVAVGVLTGGAGFGLSAVWQGAAIDFTAGAVGTLVNGGSIGQSLRNGMIGGLFGAVSAGFTYGIGSVFGGNMGAKALSPQRTELLHDKSQRRTMELQFPGGVCVRMARGEYVKLAVNDFVAGTFYRLAMRNCYDIDYT